MDKWGLSFGRAHAPKDTFLKKTLQVVFVSNTISIVLKLDANAQVGCNHKKSCVLEVIKRQKII